MKVKTNYYLIMLSAVILFSCKKDSTIESPLKVQDISETFSKLPGEELKNSAIAYKIIKPEVGSKALDKIISLPLTNCGVIPTRIADLISGTDYFYYKFDKDNSAGASAMGFTGSIGKKELLIVRDFVRYKKLACQEGSKYVGIGLRLFIHIKSFKGKIGGSLSNIAANVELNNASATFSIKSLGFAIEGDVIADVISEADYTVENFAKLAVLHSYVLKTLKSDNPMIVDPVELPIK
jgi:hypothetical protein